MNTRPNQRDFLRGAAATSAVLVTARLSRAFETQRQFAPVKVSRDRVIREVVGLRLEILLPQPEIDYCYLSSGYMFPRCDGIILGGTWHHGDWSLEPNVEEGNYILETHTAIMKNLKSA